MLTYQWTSAGMGFVIACAIIYMVRHDYLRTGYALWWVSTAVAIAVCSLCPQLIDVVGVRLGMAYPPVLLVIVGMGLLLVKMLTMDIDRSRQERKLRRLVQKIAILEGRQGSEGAAQDDDV